MVYDDPAGSFSLAPAQNLEARLWGCFRPDVGEDAPYVCWMFLSDARAWVDCQPVAYTIRPIKLHF